MRMARAPSLSSSPSRHADTGIHYNEQRNHNFAPDSTALRASAATLRRDGKRWSAHVATVRTVATPTPLWLALGAGDRDRFLSVAQECSELGVTRLIPIETERSRQVETRLRGAGVEKGRKRAREACKQSGNPWLPLIDDVTPLAELGRMATDVKWLFGEPDGVPLGALTPREPVGWLIGPEGGFTAAEEEWMRHTLGATGVLKTG